MAIQVLVEKDSGAIDTPSLPVFVYDDGGADVSLEDAIDAIEAVAGTTIPLSILGLDNDGNPSYRRTSKAAWEFTINYRSATNKPAKPPEVGEYRAGFNWHAPRMWVQFAPEVAKFPGDTVPSWDIVNQSPDSNGSPSSSGVWLEPPVANLTKSFSVDPSTVTGSWVRSLAALMGHVNLSSLTGGAYPAGEICLVHASGTLISKEAFHVDIGWNWAQNVSGETRGEVDDVAYNGQDFVWDRTWPHTERAFSALAWKIIASYVHRVREYSDLSAIGVQPP